MGLTTDKIPNSTMLRTVILTTLAMVAFAGISLLCRFALKQTAIDAASFTSIRMVAATFVLWLIVLSRNRNAAPEGNCLVLPVAAKYNMASVVGFMSLEKTSTLLQYAVTTPLIALAWREPKSS